MGIHTNTVQYRLKRLMKSSARRLPEPRDSGLTIALASRENGSGVEIGPPDSLRAFGAEQMTGRD